MELAERHRLANIRDRVQPILDSFGTLRLQHVLRFRGIILVTPKRALEAASRNEWDKPESWPCSMERIARRLAQTDFKPDFEGESQ